MLFGLAEIGLEIENPWGFDENDLEIERYAQHIALELDTLSAMPRPHPKKWSERANMPLFPYSDKTFEDLKSLPPQELQTMLHRKAASRGETAQDPLARIQRRVSSTIRSTGAVTNKQRTARFRSFDNKLATWHRRKPSMIRELPEEHAETFGKVHSPSSTTNSDSLV